MKFSALLHWRKHWHFSGSAAAIAIAAIGGAPLAHAQIALVKSGITMNGALSGSAELMTGSSVTLNSGGSISGNLYVPGTPTITKNGSPSYGGTVVGSGSASPSGYQITLNSGSTLGHVVTQTNAVAIAAVSAPPSASGTRSVTLNSASGAAAAIGSFSTLANLTLNSNVGQIVVPAGNYGNFTANSGGGFTLGVAGATTPAVYSFQQLTLNSNTTLTVVGPVTINLPQSLTLNSSVGSSANPAWLQFNISSGGVTLNSNVSLYGSVNAPTGSVTINSGSTLQGSLACNQLTINSNGTLKVSSAAVADSPTVSISSPAANTLVAAPGSFSLQATATDVTGTISQVVYYSGGSSIGQSTTSPYTINWTGVAAGTYSLTAVATNSFGNSTTSSPVSVVVAAAPGAPSVTGVTAGAGKVSVAFNPPASTGGSPITGYIVTSSPGGFTATGTGSPLVVSGLTAGTAYTFTVKATNAVGTSAASAASAQVTPTGVSSAPSIANVTVSDGQAIVTVTPPANTGGLPLSYTVTSVPGGITATGSGPTFTLTGLTDGVAYSFTVTAANADGTSAASAASTPVVPTGLPSTPTITAITTGDGQATVAFNPPASTGGLAIISYTVTSSPGGFTATGSGSPLTVTGLTDGTAYTFTVTAANSAGSSPASAVSTQVIPTGIASAPAIASVTASDGQATVTITPPASSGGLPLTYTVTSVPGGITATGYGPNFTLTGLTDGVSYSFIVTASNSDGTSVASAASSPVEPSGLPGAPTVFAVAVSSGTASVSFSPPSNTGGLPITSYTATSIPSGITFSGTTSPLVVTGLANGTSYTFTVTATNANGTGPASAASPPVAPTGLAGAPTIGGVTVGPGSATVSFLPPSDTGGLPILEYQVASTDGVYVGTNSTSPITITGLTRGRSYSFTATAVNSFGDGFTSAPSNPVFIPYGLPDAPTIASVSQENGQVIVTINPPPDTGGQPISSYTVVTSTTGSTPSANAVYSTTTAAEPSVAINGLTGGLTYSFTALANNSVGSSVASAPVQLSVTSAPGKPVITGVTVGDGLAVVSFTPPDSHGSPIITYAVTATPGAIVATASTGPITVRGLTDGVSYTFTVTAQNAVGTSLASSPSAAVTPMAPIGVPSAPVITTAVINGTTATLAIDPTTATGGSPILYWKVTTSPATPDGPLTFTSEPFVIPNLAAGTTYTFTVTAVNAAGASVASAPIQSSAPQTVIVSLDPNANYWDVVDGDLFLGDNSEADINGNIVSPAPAVAPTVALFWPSVYGGQSGFPFLLTVDPVSGAYTTFDGGTVDLQSGIETNYFDGPFPVDLTWAYFLTQSNTVVSVTNPGVQLDPVTLLPVSTAPYLIAWTLPEFSLAFGSPPVF